MSDCSPLPLSRQRSHARQRRRKLPYVYAYFDEKRRVGYVGRGDDITRAEAHISGTHNEGLRSLVASGKFEVHAVGPFEEKEAAHLESILISLLDGAPGFHNLAPGAGPRFVPLGVPIYLSGRLNEPALTPADIGRLADGALLVRLSSGGTFSSDGARAKFDPARPDVRTIFENVVRWWWLEPLLTMWAAGARPGVVAGIAGPTGRRYVAGAVLVDRNAAIDSTHRPDYQVPALTASGSPVIELDDTAWVPADADVDACGLRGRLVKDALFSGYKQGHYYWVDGAGVIRHAPARP